MIAASTLKKMRNDTLVSLDLYQLSRESGPLDAKDIKILGDFIKQTRSLREVSFAYAAEAFQQLSGALKQNRSIVKLNVSQIIHSLNVSVLTDVLKASSTISDLNIDNCTNLAGDGFAEFVKTMGTHPSITHLSAAQINYDRVKRAYDSKPLVNILTKSPNILKFLPEGEVGQKELEKVCLANRGAVRALLNKARQNDTRDLTVQDVSDILTRMPAFLNIAETEVIRDRKLIARMLVNIEDVASSHGIDFSIPPSYADIAVTLPRSFYPSADKVDFAQTAPAKALDSLEIYKAVEAGQVSELLSFLQRQGRKITAADCLFKPEGKRESMIELVARQGTLPSIMTVANWTGNPRGFKEAAATVPAREWVRQMGDMSLDKLLSCINAASFKKPPQLRP